MLTVADLPADILVVIFCLFPRTPLLHALRFVCRKWAATALLAVTSITSHGAEMLASLGAVLPRVSHLAIDSANLVDFLSSPPVNTLEYARLPSNGLSRFTYLTSIHFNFNASILAKIVPFHRLLASNTATLTELHLSLVSSSRAAESPAPLPVLQLLALRTVTLATMTDDPPPYIIGLIAANVSSLTHLELRHRCEGFNLIFEQPSPRMRNLNVSFGRDSRELVTSWVNSMSSLTKLALTGERCPLSMVATIRSDVLETVWAKDRTEQDGILALANCPRLSSLPYTLVEHNIDKIAAILPTFTCLTKLEVATSALQVPAFARIELCTSLRILTLSGPLSAAATARLCAWRLPHLTHLHWTTTHGVFDDLCRAQLARIVTCWPSVRVFNFTHCSEVGLIKAEWLSEMDVAVAQAERNGMERLMLGLFATPWAAALGAIAARRKWLRVLVFDIDAKEI